SACRPRCTPASGRLHPRARWLDDSEPRKRWRRSSPSSPRRQPASSRERRSTSMAACGRLDPRRSSLNSSRKLKKGRQANDPIAHLVRDRAKATKLGPKVELVVSDLDDPASLKPAFASVDEAFIVVNGKDLNRLESNA